MKLLFIIVPTVLLIWFTSFSVEAKTYENEKYSFEYPIGCKLEKTENRFSTTDATLECKGDAGLSFESSRETSESLSGSSDDDLIDNMESVFELNYDNTGIVETGTDKYVINNYTAPYIIGTYDQEFSNAFGFTSTEPYVLMTMIIKLNDNEMVLLQHRNSEDDFDKQLPMVEKIFQSVKALGNGAKTQTEADNSFANQDDLAKTRAICDRVTTQSERDLCETLLN